MTQKKSQTVTRTVNPNHPLPDSLAQFGVLINSPKVNTKQVPAKDLVLHPFLEKMGMISADDSSIIEFFASESLAFKHYNAICVTKDDYIISQPETWQAAKLANPDMLLTVDVLDIEEDDVIRFINTKSLFFRRNHQAKWSLFKELRDYLENNGKGQQWKSQLNAGDINETVAKITDYSRSLVKQVQKVGKYADEHPEWSWSKIGYDDNQMSLKEMYNSITPKKATSDLELSDDDLKEAQKKESKEKAKKEEKRLKSLRLMGAESIKFVLNWLAEDQVVADVADFVHGSPTDGRLYQYKDNDGNVLVEIKVNVDKAFKL